MSNTTTDGERQESDEQNKLAICTIIAKNYLAFARVLTNSFLEHNPGGKVFVLLIDRVDGYFDPNLEKFHLVTVEELGIPEIKQILFQYNIVEACTGLKPYFLDYLFNKYNLRKLAYFDPDILITADLNELAELLDEYSVILTPHMLEPIPLDDQYKPREIDLLHVGTYNLGFIALAGNPTATQLLKWWHERLSKMCVWVDPSRVLFNDQKWIDLVPGYFDGVRILRDPGYNVAYWNLQSRQVELNEGEVTANGRPLKFFHFSGFNPDNINQVSVYQNRFTLGKLKHLRPLFEEYRDRLLANSYNETRGWPYAFDYFDNGIKIINPVREQYLNLGEKMLEFGDPFSTRGRRTFFTWLSQPAEKSFSDISRFWHCVYLSRPDLRSAYPDVFGRDGQAFLYWCANNGRFEYEVDQVFLPPDTVAKRPILRLRYYPRLVLTGVRVIRNEGWRSFWSKFRSWLRQRTAERKRARIQPPASDITDD